MCVKYMYYTSIALITYYTHMNFFKFDSICIQALVFQRQLFTSLSGNPLKETLQILQFPNKCSGNLTTKFLAELDDFMIKDDPKYY